MDAPIAAAEFAAAMAGFAPFEPGPELAVAVSGGRDSMALTLLAAEWAAARGGAVLGLTVDHGLRPEAAAEAARVGRWLAGRGIRHRVLSHDGPRPAVGIQAAAREFRYRLLAAACREAGILHLLVGHHRGDQAETVAIRAGRASGQDGLAGMAPCRETDGPRLLRPLLAMPRGRLTATLDARGQDWIEDPSNDDVRFRRVRLRREGIDADTLLAAAAGAGLRRAGLERQVARAAADHVRVAPEGHLLLAAGGLAALPADVVRRLLQGVVATVGDPGVHGARGAAIERLRMALGAPFAPRTLGGCRFLPWRGQVLACREPAATGPDVPLAASSVVRWDDRFALAVPPGMPPSCRVGALGDRRPAPRDCLAGVPGPVRPTLPAIWCGDALLAIPTAGWRAREDVPRVEAWFQPVRALAGGPFAVV
ncbi:tRNA lysidine(34) synthetase TilS [Stella sp.]|uniref:tRNA lysidine(34) synthetase TilS n=1 Tax=Stella sp. TaxID=2912054 RepID=UPI0035B15BA5